jgi:hypothetical protein
MKVCCDRGGIPTTTSTTYPQSPLPCWQYFLRSTIRRIRIVLCSLLPKDSNIALSHLSVPHQHHDPMSRSCLYAPEQINVSSRSSTI